MSPRHTRQPQAPTGVTGRIATALYVKVAQNRARGKIGQHRKRRRGAGAAPPPPSSP